MKTMGEIISRRRKEMGITQAELAERMNVTDKAVSKWERNLSCPDVGSISRLAEVLEVSVGELLNAEKPDDSGGGRNKIIKLILKAVPLAMGVATAVISILNELDARSAFVMLGIGLACLSLNALDNGDK